MNTEQFHDFCMSLKGTTDTMPFGPENVVYKVMNKMFALMPLDVIPLRVNLKNLPQKNIELRADHQSIIPGYHMNKEHWNTVILNGELKNQEIEVLIKESYECVVSGLTKKDKEILQNL